MDQEEMVETYLTQEMIDAGAALIRRLDEKGVQPDAVFWFYFPDIPGWKLVIAEIKVGKAGPRQAYQDMQETLAEYKSEIPTISLDDITLKASDAPLVALMRMVTTTGPAIAGIRLKDNVINGVFIEDAYVYRLM
jgi:hypothetical protein